MEYSERPKPYQLFASSLLCSLSAVGLTCTIHGLLSLSLGSEDSSVSSILWGIAWQLPILLPLGLGMSWVATTVDSAQWRFTVLASALIQLPLTSYVAGVFERDFASFPLACTLIGSALLPRLLRAKRAANSMPVLAEPRDLSRPRLRPAVTLANLHSTSSGTADDDHLAAPESTAPQTPAATQFPATPLFHAIPPEAISLPPPLESAPIESAPVRTQASILVCEILNHAQLAYSLPPGEFTDLVNRLLTICAETSAARTGQTDRSDSESFRAFFTHSNTGESHAASAALTALALKNRIEALSEECELKCGRELDVRIGVSTGEVLVAHFGTHKFWKQGVAGESAEWSRRLAGANQLYGSKILISTQTRKMAETAVELRPIDLLQRQLPPEAPEEVFELLAIAGTLSADAQTRLTQYKDGFTHFRNRNWAAARKSLKAARPLHGNDDAIDLLLHRIDEQETLAGFVLDEH